MRVAAAAVAAALSLAAPAAAPATARARPQQHAVTPAPPVARFVPSSPDPRHVFVLDSAHLLADTTVALLQARAEALQAGTGADVVFVTLPTLGGRDIAEAALYLGRMWKVGSLGRPGDPDRNRGLVVLYVPDRTRTAGSNIRVEVGQGLEGSITDARSHGIISAMRPYLAEKQYDAAVLAGWDSAAAMVRGDAVAESRVVRGVSGGGLAGPTIPTAMPVRPPSNAAPPTAVVVILVVTMLGLLLLATLVRWLGRLSLRAAAAPTYDEDGHPALVLPMAKDNLERFPDDRPSPPSRSSFGHYPPGAGWSGGAGGGDGSDTDPRGGRLGGGGGFSGGGSSDTV